MTDRIQTLKQQIQQLEQLRADGTLSPDAANAARADLERQLIEAVLAAPAASASAPAASASPASPAAPTVTDDTATVPPAPAAARPSRRLWIGLGAFVLVFGAAGYAWLGNTAAWSTSPAAVAAAAPEEGASSAHSMGVQQIETMLDSLRQRLKDKPNDADGWLMLGRTLSVLGRFEDAVPAYRKVLSIQAGNAQAMADLADALAMLQKGSFAGEPDKLIQAALKADPKNVKAIALAGTQAYEKGDFKQAISLWERGISLAQPESDLAKQLQSSLAEARQAANGGAPVPAADDAAVASGATVRGRVELAPALKGKAKPDDTVFVFARAAEGPRMPLAIVRKKVSDLPFDFVLDDSTAMNPEARLSGAKAVVVGARVSASGQAMPQSGDLQGQSGTVTPGASGLRVVISEVLP